MYQKLCIIFLALSIVLTPTSFANINRAPCDTEYDKCKQKVENMFDKKPCRKAREQCVASLTQKLKNTTKRKMLMGEDPQSAKNSMRPWVKSEKNTAAAARERLKARAKNKSMRESIKPN